MKTQCCNEGRVQIVGRDRFGKHFDRNPVPAGRLVNDPKQIERGHVRRSARQNLTTNDLGLRRIALVGRHRFASIIKPAISTDAGPVAALARATAARRSLLFIPAKGLLNSRLSANLSRRPGVLTASNSTASSRLINRATPPSGRRRRRWSRRSRSARRRRRAAAAGRRDRASSPKRPIGMSRLSAAPARLRDNRD